MYRKRVFENRIEPINIVAYHDIHRKKTISQIIVKSEPYQKRSILGIEINTKQASKQTGKHMIFYYNVSRALSNIEFMTFQSSTVHSPLLQK